MRAARLLLLRRAMQSGARFDVSVILPFGDDEDLIGTAIQKVATHLRELGLSVTQSARLIAYRDVRGGYESLDEIDDVPGLSEKTRDELKDRLKLGA